MELLNPTSVNGTTAVEEQPQVAAAVGPSLDVRAIWGRAIRKWYLFLLFPLLTGFLGYAYLRYEVPQFEVRGTILIKESPEDRALSQAVGGVGGVLVENGATNLINQIEILGSFAILKAAVDTLDLEIDYLSEGSVKNTNLYEVEERPFSVASYSSDGQRLFGKSLFIELSADQQSYSVAYDDRDNPIGRGRFGQPLVLPYGTLLLERNEEYTGSRASMSIVVRDPISVARAYGRKMSITPLRSSELLEISLQDAVPARAVDFINAIITVYNTFTILEEKEIALRTTEFVNDRLDYLNRELNEVEVAAEDYIINNDIVGGTDRELEAAFTQLTENERQIIELSITQEAISRLRGVITDRPSDSLRYLPYTVELANLNLGPILEQYNQLLLEREQLQQSAKADNPALIPFTENLTEVSRTISRALDEAAADLTGNIDDLKAANDEIFSEIRRIPGKQRGLMALERQQTIREQLYLFLLQRREETQLSSAAAVENVRVFEAPMPRGSTSTGPVPVYSIALLLGLLLPIGWVTLEEFLDDTIKSPDKLKKLSAAPPAGHRSLRERTPPYRGKCH